MGWWLTGALLLALCATAVLVCAPSGPHFRLVIDASFGQPVIVADGPALAPLVVLTEAAQQSGAVCLDGSPAAYYFQPGTGAGAHNWIIHFEGGGWCTSLEDCVLRSGGPLGSSRGWPRMRQLTGHLSRDSGINPDLHTWNAAYLPYCDGASFAGNVSQPQSSGGQRVFFRGAAILDAVLADLLHRGLSAAQQVLVTGCSAGGLAVYLHCDYVAARVGGDAVTKCMPDAGFFLDAPDVWGQRRMEGLFRAAIKLHNVLGNVNAACVAALPAGDAWKCFYAPYSAAFVQAPLFIVNPLFDTWQIANVVLGGRPAPEWAGCRYSLAGCTPEQHAALRAFADQLAARALSTLAGAKGDGAFLFSCFLHCPNLDSDAWWQQVTIRGTALREAAADWLLDRGGDHFHVDKTSDYERGTNPSCGITV